MIILSSTAEGLAEWRAFAERLGLPVLAELDSVLQGDEALAATYPLLRGRLVGLERGKRVTGTVLTQLASVVSAVFAVKPGALRQLHLEMAPVELAVDLERVASTLQLAQGGLWRPAEIAAVLAYLPTQTALAIYGRGTNWLYTALALHTWPAEFYQYDARLGWVKPALLAAVAQAATPLLRCTRQVATAYTRVHVQIPDTYLDYDAIQGCGLPAVPLDRGVIIDGKLPLWLFTGIAQAYGTAPWLAVYQPQLGDVVVMSRHAVFQVGALIATAAPTANPDSAAPSTLGPPKASPPK